MTFILLLKSKKMEQQSKTIMPAIHPFASDVLEDLKDRVIHTLDEYPVAGCLSMQVQIDKLIRDISYFIKTHPKGEFRVFIYEDENSWSRDIPSIGLIITNYREKPDEDRIFKVKIAPNWSNFGVVQLTDIGMEIPVKKINK